MVIRFQCGIGGLRPFIPISIKPIGINQSGGLRGLRDLEPPVPDGRCRLSDYSRALDHRGNGIKKPERY